MLLFAALFLLPLLLLLLLLWGCGHGRRAAFSLDGRVVLITGAGRGLGRRLAATIRERAPLATLVLLDVDVQSLETLRGPRVLVAACDVSDDRCVRGCMKARMCMGARGNDSGGCLSAAPSPRAWRTCSSSSDAAWTCS